jgi:hypothetical protein
LNTFGGVVLRLGQDRITRAKINRLGGDLCNAAPEPMD